MARPNTRRTPQSSATQQVPKAIQRIILTATTIITLCLVYLVIVRHALQSTDEGHTSTRVLTAQTSLDDSSNTTALHNSTCRAKSHAVDVHDDIRCVDNATLCCDAMLGNVPKGPMPHEWLWRAWLTQIQDLVPRNTLHAACTHHSTNTTNLTSILQHCATQHPISNTTHSPSHHIHTRQHLFSIYVHAPPSWGNYTPDSIFYGRMLTQRLQAQWGTFDLVQAARLLLAAALAEANTQRFVLLSESCVPLYAPQVVYMQLMAEGKSRVDACGSMGVDHHRYRYMMSESNIDQKHWRKSWQWWMLIRSHAQLVVDDQEVARAFEKYCVSINATHVCYSDEHYIPTLLATHGLDNTTSCTGGPTYVQFWEGDPHPQTFRGNNVTSVGVRTWRQPHKGCCATYGNTVQQANRGLVLLTDVFAVQDVCRGVEHNVNTSDGGIAGRGALEEDTVEGAVEDTEHVHHHEMRTNGALAVGPYQPMPMECPLFARKVGDDAQAELQAALYSCSAGLYVLDNAADCAGDGVFPNAPLEEQLNAEAAHAAEQLQLAAERHRTEYFAVKRAARLHVAEQQATQQRMDVREPGS